MYNTTVIPAVLDGGSQIVLANMLPEKRLICTYDPQGLAKPYPIALMFSLTGKFYVTVIFNLV